MNDADREAIQDLFARLRAAEASAPERDPAAEAYIRDRLEQNPSAAYYMAQTIIAQEQALKAAGERLGYSENGRQPEPRQGGGGLLGGLFGGGRRDAAPEQRPSGPWGQAPARGGGMMGRGGGGFLAGAATTAAGVAGGVVLGSMLTDMFDIGEDGGSEALASAGSGEEKGLFGGGGEADGGDGGGLFGGGGEGGFGEDFFG